MRRFFVAACAAFAIVTGAAHADTVSMQGDADCFGLPGVLSCPDGSLWRDGLGGVFFTDYSGPGDPPFTDNWDAHGGVSFTHVYVNPAGALSASLTLRIAGIHDINTGTVYAVFVDGTSVGTIAPNLAANAFQEVLTYTFVVPLALLDGSSIVSFGGTGGDGYSIDYSELRIATRQVVPEPSTLLLLMVATLAAGRVRRRVR